MPLGKSSTWDPDTVALPEIDPKGAPFCATPQAPDELKEPQVNAVVPCPYAGMTKPSAITATEKTRALLLQVPRNALVTPPDTPSDLERKARRKADPTERRWCRYSHAVFGIGLSSLSLELLLTQTHSQKN